MRIMIIGIIALFFCIMATVWIASEMADPVFIERAPTLHREASEQ